MATSADLLANVASLYTSMREASDIVIRTAARMSIEFAVLNARIAESSKQVTKHGH